MPICLILDRSDLLRHEFARLMAGRGWQMISEAAAMPALEKTAFRTPDLIVIGRHLADTDGVRAIGCVRSLPHLAEVPVLYLTPSLTVEGLGQILQAGATDYLACPFDKDIFDFKLTQLMARAPQPRGVVPIVSQQTQVRA